MVRYPSGHGMRRNTSLNSTKRPKRNIQYGSRGMSLEGRLNESNHYYLTRNRAIIHKKPTPIQVVRVDYPRRSAAKITEAYYRQASTTDYNGVYEGYYIDFEAKETTNKTSFPLQNLPIHQRTHMKQCIEHGGIAFVLFSFKVHQEVFLLPYENLMEFLAKESAKSIPYDFIKEKGYECPTGAFPMIDYLHALDQYLNNLK